MNAVGAAPYIGRRASRRLRLLWLSDGTSAHTIRWLESLGSRCHEVLLFSLPEPDAALYSMKNVIVETAGFPPALVYAKDGSIRKAAYLRVLPRLKSLARQYGPDLVHAHYASSYGVLAMLARLRPLVTSIWGADVYATPSRSVLHRRLIRVALRYPDRVLSTSEIMRSQGVALGRPDIHVVPFGIDTDRFAPVAAAPNRAIVIGTVKALEIKYGIDVLLKAFAILVAERPKLDIRLRIAGKGSKREELLALHKELGLDGRAEFIGAVPYSDAHEVHQSLDIAVFPSVDESESFGVSAVEAQACGVPVVVSRIGGLPEAIEEGVTGVVVPAGDESALARAIGELLDRPDLRARMGQQGRERACRLFSIGACTDTLEENYEAVLATRGSSVSQSAHDGVPSGARDDV